MKSVAFICKSNPMSCADSNYRKLLNAKNALTIQGLSVWNEICCKLNNGINIIKEMINVRDEFKECRSEQVKGFIDFFHH